jgi:hypothetical protein
MATLVHQLVKFLTNGQLCIMGKPKPSAKIHSVNQLGSEEN